MKKIVFIYRGDGFGGVETSLINLVNSLTEWDVTVIFTTEDRFNISEGFDSRVHIKIEKIPEYSFKKRIGGCKKISEILKEVLLRIKIQIFSFEIWREYERVVKNLKSSVNFFDIAVTYGCFEPIQSAYIKKCIKSLKTVMWVHTDYKKLKKSEYDPIKYIKDFNRIFCVSKAAQESFSNIYPELKSKTEVFCNLICYEDYWKKAGLIDNKVFDNKGYKLLTVGRLSPEKGQDMIPKAVELLKADGFEFCWYLIGSGELETSISKEIKNRDIERHLILLGEQKNPYPYYRDADIYIQTSLHEGYCIAMAEARCFNLPIITTDIPTAEEFVKDGVNGYITKLSSRGLYMAIKKIFSDSKEYERIRDNSKDLMKNKKSQISMLDNLLK